MQQLVLHIPRGGSRINYGMIHTKVNTEAADVAMKSSTVAEGLELHIDLTAAGGFPLKPGRNSVELDYEDQFGRAKYYNFLVDFQSPGADPRGSRGIVTEPATSQRPTRGTGKLMAVVIGISRYQDNTNGIPNLRFADQDASAFADYLKSPAGGGIASQDLTLLLNEDATVQNVRHALFTFLTQAKAEDTVIIYIAGHGAPDPHDPRNLYLITTDAKANDMGGTAFPMWQMQDVFARILKAHRVITLVDTCHSFGFSGLRKGETGGEGNNLFNQYLQRYAADSQRAVITASDISELSYEDTSWGGGHGVFTWYLLRGLQGEADTNHDGVVTAGELFAYLHKAVPQATSGRQNPRAMDGLAASLIVSSAQKTHAMQKRLPVHADWSAL